MQFNVSDLLRAPYGAVREYEVDEDVRIDGQPRRFAGHVRLDRVPQGIFVRAELRGVRPGECSRCLDGFSEQVEITIEELYVPQVDLVTGASVQPPEGEEDAYRINERHVLDLSLPAQQDWTMAQPIAPVCNEDCAGFCPICGIRRDAQHECAAESTDGRWEKLRDLRLR
jgi:uncharacterized protein